MIEDLEYLIQLQEIDLRIREQELSQEQFPAAVAELENGISKAKTDLEDIEAKLKKMESEKGSFEEQISKAHESLEKSQSRLNSIKTNREYDAVHAEIETHKNIINSAETRRKNLENEIEKLKASVEESKKEYERIKAENEPKIAELKEKIGKIDTEISKIMVERDAVSPKISKHLLRTYDLIRKKRKTGRALSLVSDSRTCTVCFKVLEPQLYNEIKRGTKLTLCQSCGSILVWDQSSKKEQHA
jgi:predicted  nucleic acid-binding Zn-ribbon protein